MVFKEYLDRADQDSQGTPSTPTPYEQDFGPFSP